MPMHSPARTRSWPVLAALVVFAAPALLPAAAAPPPLHQVSATVCKDCHVETFRQWAGSMHAKSSAIEDPIHGAFYQQEVGDPRAEGQVHKKMGNFPVCLSCHAPNAARDKTTKLDAKPAYSEGVNCIACHTLAEYKGIKGEDGKLRLGIAAYRLSDTLKGPAGFPRDAEALKAADDAFGGAVSGGDDQKPNPHLGEPVVYGGKEIPAMPLAAAAIQFKTSDACMGCHDQRNNPQGVPLCQTGNEYMEGASKVVCQSCHMAVTGGMSDHSMGGGHSPGMLKRSLVFTLDHQGEPGKLAARVRLQNLQPHAMPTGAPFRNLHLKLTAYDSKGEVVWQNAKGHPSKDDPQAYFSYSMTDDKGMPAQPPTATKSGPDTRLKPHEVRELTYDIPAKDVALVRGEVYYGLLWPALAEKFKDLPQELREPVLIGVAETSIKAP